MKKMCPILTAGLLSAHHYWADKEGHIVDIEQLQCAKERCALWNVELKMCGIRIIREGDRVR